MKILPVLQQFDFIIDNYPEKISIKDKIQSLTYISLNKKSNQFANYLLKNGISKGDTIAFLLNPDINLAIVILAIMKCGAVYVPIHQSNPIERINFILEDSNCKFFITNLSINIENPIKQIDITNFDFDSQDEKNPDIKNELSDNAFIIYTSGSTGKPKGVILNHKNLSSYLDWHINFLLPKINVQLPLSSSMCFAAGITQFFTPLLTGNILNILDFDLIKSPFDLLQWYKINPGFGIYCVPTLWDNIISFTELNSEYSEFIPKVCILSGEQIKDNLIVRSKQINPDLKLWNLYGPTEFTANCSFYEIKSDNKVFLGEPISNTKLLLLNENNNICNRNETGEIIIAGDCLTPGYLNQPELNERYFINGVEHYPDRFYKTGDLAKYDESGNLIFLGRKDNQIKIRGYRVELNEIENKISNFNKSIKNAVIYKNDTLIAYLCSENQFDIKELKNYLWDTLPQFMIPDFFFLLDKLPQLPNGKIDRKSLPDYQELLSNENSDAMKSENEIESRLFEIFKKVLKLKIHNKYLKFFELGGNSIKANFLLNHINKEFKLNLKLFDLINNSSISELSNLISSTVINDGLIEFSDINLNQIPLGLNQKSLFLLKNLKNDLSAYNIIFTITFEGELNFSKLENALEKLINKHIIFKSSFYNENSETFLKINQDIDLDLMTKDLSYLSESESLSKFNEIIQRESLHIFNFNNDNLFRFKIVKINDNKSILISVIHHIIFDGISINIFYKDLMDLYFNKIDSSQNQHFIKFLINQNNRLNNNYFSNSKEFWINKLNEKNAILDFPYDYPPKSDLNFEGERVISKIDKHVKKELISFCKKKNLTVYQLLTSVFFLTLYKYTNQSNILIGTPFGLRSSIEDDSSIGFYTNTVVLGSTFDESLTLLEYVKTIQNEILSVIQYFDYPFELLVSELLSKRDLNISPFFQFMFAYHDKMYEYNSNDLKTEVYENGNPYSAKYMLHLESQDNNNDIELKLNFNKHALSTLSMLKFLERFNFILNKILSHPEINIASIELVSENDLNLINQINNTNYDFGKLYRIEENFEKIVEEYPNNIALVDGDLQITYFELNTISNNVAKNLSKLDISNNEPIGIHLESSNVMVISLLGILKSKCCYLPLDPYYPSERIEYLVNDSKVRYIITDKVFQKDLENLSCQILLIDDLIQESNCEFKNKNSSENIAYIIYTSGSTGNPKGVVIEHEKVMNLLLWGKSFFSITEKDVFLNRTSINFDISVFEIFLPLITGAKLVVSQKDNLQSPEFVKQIIQKNQVTVTQFVPSSFKMFVDNNLLQNINSIRLLISAGEKLPLDLMKNILNNYKGELYNLYGPTEATIYATYWKCHYDDNTKLVPIGSPITNYRIYILDEHLRHVPLGVLGEIYIAGDVLSKGYYNKDELSKEKFIPDIFSNAKDSKMYKTGDIGRILNNGEIEILGRKDNQIKLRGLRIELDEISFHINQMQGIKTSVVLIKQSADNDMLIAFVIPDDTKPFDEISIKNELRKKLPEYMVPSYFVKIDSVPLLPNGKIDSKELLKINVKINRMVRTIMKNDLEEKLSSIWASVLGHENFTVEDNFFDVGGNSLMMVKIKNSLLERANIEVSVIDLFQYPTIQQLSNSINNDSDQKLSNEISKRIQMHKNIIKKNINNIHRRLNNGKQ